MATRHDLEFEYGISFAFGRDSIRYFEVRASTDRGQMFLDAYWEATDRKTSGDEVWDEDSKQWLPETLHIMPDDFDRFKRQVSLAGVTMQEAIVALDDVASP